jgi:hypothetical protein
MAAKKQGNAKPRETRTFFTPDDPGPRPKPVLLPKPKPTTQPTKK